MIENKVRQLQYIYKKLEAEYAGALSLYGKSKTSISSLVFTEIKGDWGIETAQASYEKCCVFRGTDIADIIAFNLDSFPERYIKAKGIEKKALTDWDIVIEMSGGGPAQPTGRAAIVFLQYAKDKMLVSNFCRGIRCKCAEDAVYLLAALKHLYTTRISYMYEVGTTGIKNLNLSGMLQENYLPNWSEKEKNAFCDASVKEIEYGKKLMIQLNSLKKMRSLLLGKYF